MKSVFLAPIACALLLTCAAFGAKNDKADATPAQAVVLDHNEFLCDNCLFGMSDYYVCFEANSRILIGHEKVRVQTRKKTPAELFQDGKSLPIRFDGQYIWVTPATGKEIRLTQDYATKIFLDNDRCKAAVK